MRALLYRNGRLSLVQDYPGPTPQDGEARVRVLMAGICNTDIEITRGYKDFQGVLGHEFVGIVENIYGVNAREQYGHLVGMRVVGEINAACYQPSCTYCAQGIHSHCPERTTLGIANRDGAFADYLMLPVQNLHSVPDTVSDEEAVFVEPLAANLEMFEQVHVSPTDCIVILGDGKMGQLAAQVMALSGAQLTMVGRHEEKLALARQRGIETVLAQDVQQRKYVDVVVECTGSAAGLELAIQLVRPRGTIILKSTVADAATLHLAPLVIDEIRVQGSRCGPFAPALRALERKLIDVRPLISACYSLDEAEEAFDVAFRPGILKVLMRM